MAHPALTATSVAVVTGGASGIGRAAALAFAGMGMKIVLVDRSEEGLAEAAQAVQAAGAADVMTSTTDVSDFDQMTALNDRVTEHFGGADILMNNAGIGMRSSAIADRAATEKMIAVNLWGPINGCMAFAPGIIERGRPGAIINTGSKQGITMPPGNPGYNVSKAGLKAYTEALSHELRNTEGAQITAHLLVPGFVHTAMIGMAENHPSAWTAEQTVTFFIDSLSRGDFYILCPDNDVDRATDEKRIAWAAGDIIENRPALSRWHPDFVADFAALMME